MDKDREAGKQVSTLVHVPFNLDKENTGTLTVWFFPLFSQSEEEMVGPRLLRVDS